MLAVKKQIQGKDFLFEIKVGPPRVTTSDWRYYPEEIKINGEVLDVVYGAQFVEHYIPNNKEKLPCLRFVGDAKKKLVKVIGITPKEDDVFLVLGDCREKWAEMKEVAIIEMAKLLEAEQKRIDSRYEDPQKLLDVCYHTSYKFSAGEYGKSTRGQILKAINESNKATSRLKEKLKDYAYSFDYGDYSSWTNYEISIGEFEGFIKEIMKQVLIEKEQAEIEYALDKMEVDKRRSKMDVQIIDKGKEHSGDGPTYYTHVEITDKETGEKLKFACRNIFDFGYVINPLYPIIEGISGGIEIDGYWDVADGAGRELTDVEKRMLKYLHEFPPISTEIRM